MATAAIAVLCAAAALAHVTLVFLHVAPSNPISQRFDKQITAWVFPLFEQNWLLFAPNPEASNTRIFARTGWTTASGENQVGDWIDISAVDNANTRHNLMPSHATQNMLRRAWDAYLGSHGEDDVSYDEWSLAREKYLRNIAVQRATAHSSQPFQGIQLKAVVSPIPAPNAGSTTQTEPYTRTLPWWNATPDGR